MVSSPANCLPVILISFITLYPFTKVVCYNIPKNTLWSINLFKKSEIIPFCFKNPNNPVHVILGIFLVCKSVNITITVNVFYGVIIICLWKKLTLMYSLRNQNTVHRGIRNQNTLGA